MKITNRVIALLIIAALVGMFASYVIFTQWYVLGVERYKVNFTVTDAQVMGFALGSGEKNDTLQFGKISYNGGADRMASVISAHSVVGRVSFEGDTAPFMVVTPSCFEIPAGQRQNLQFHAGIPAQTRLGDYFGSVRVIYTRPLPWNKC